MIRSIFSTCRLVINENGDKIYSDIATMETETSVDKVTSDREVAGRAYYDMQGRRVAAPSPGLYIERTTYTDGTSSVAKKVMH